MKYYERMTSPWILLLMFILGAGATVWILVDKFETNLILPYIVGAVIMAYAAVTAAINDVKTYEIPTICHVMFFCGGLPWAVMMWMYLHFEKATLIWIVIAIVVTIVTNIYVHKTGNGGGDRFMLIGLMWLLPGAGLIIALAGIVLGVFCSLIVVAKLNKGTGLAWTDKKFWTTIPDKETGESKPYYCPLALPVAVCLIAWLIYQVVLIF